MRGRNLNGLLSCILVVCLLLSLCVSVDAYAKESSTLSKPKLSSWKNVTDENQFGDGVTYKVTWKPVKGASYYEIKYYEIETSYTGEDWYVWTETTKKCSASISFSSVYKFKVKVRAVKKKNGKKIYSKWSTSKTKVMYD